MNAYVGMDKQTEDIFTVARFVHLPAARLPEFLAVLSMCGYEIKKRDAAAEEKDK